MRFPFGGERVTCRGSKFTNSLGRTQLTNSLGKQQLELSTHTWSGRAPWNRGKFVCQRASSKRFPCSFLFSFSIFELGGITKQLMTSPGGNREFCFPSTSVSPLALFRGMLRVSGKQNSLSPLGPVIQCSLFVFCSNRPTANRWQYHILRGWMRFTIWLLRGTLRLSLGKKLEILSEVSRVGKKWLLAVCYQLYSVLAGVKWTKSVVWYKIWRLTLRRSPKAVIILIFPNDLRYDFKIGPQNAQNIFPPNL